MAIRVESEEEEGEEGVGMRIVVLEHHWFVAVQILTVLRVALQELGVLALVESTKNRGWSPATGVYCVGEWEKKENEQKRTEKRK